MKNCKCSECKKEFEKAKEKNLPLLCYSFTHSYDKHFTVDYSRVLNNPKFQVFQENNVYCFE